MQRLGWLHDICGNEDDIISEKYKFLLRPFRIGEYAVATNGHTLVAIKTGDDCPFDSSPAGEKATLHFLSTPSGNAVYPFAPLKDWAAHRYDDNKPEPSILHGAAVDRSLLWQAFRNIQDETYQLNQVDQQGCTKGMFVFDGSDWRVFVMGLRNVVQTGELPEYAPVEQPRDTVTVGGAPEESEPQSTKPVNEKEI